MSAKQPAAKKAPAIKAPAKPQVRPELGPPCVEIEGVHKWYGDTHILRGVDLSVRDNEKVVILGPSGSGKSTLVRCVNGLEPYQEGKIKVVGVDLGGGAKEAAVAKRKTKTWIELAVALGGFRQGTRALLWAHSWTHAQVALGHEPTVDEVAEWWNESRRTCFRQHRHEPQ